MRKESGSAMIEKRMRKCIGSICLAAALCAVCMSPYAQETESEGAVAAKSEMAKVVAVTEDWMVPVTAAELKDGTYDIEVRSSSSMFQITDCTLTVEDGRMSAAMTMGGTGYRYVCMATPEEAAKADEKDFLFPEIRFFVFSVIFLFLYSVKIYNGLKFLKKKMIISTLLK